MPSVPGYQVTDQLCALGFWALYSAKRDQDGHPVAIKVSPKRRLSESEGNGLRAEAELLRRLNVKGIPGFIDLLERPESIHLVTERIAGLPVRKRIDDDPISLPDFLKIAERLSEIVAAVHEQQIVHGGINPTTVFWDESSQQVSLCGFEYASMIERDSGSTIELPTIERDPTYLSPEQTGRVDRLPDLRSDLYTMGILFYEMLTGRPPFEAKDPAELIHAHLARTPQPFDEGDQRIPRVLSEIVMRLLEKEPESRYQSVRGLKADLERCLEQLESEGCVEGFDIGLNDRPEFLQISEKLYGRAQGVESMQETLDRVCSGAAVLQLVAGYSGVGKTALVETIRKPVTLANGQFVAGRFSPLTRDVPYTALAQALQESVRRILTGGDDEIARWRHRLHQVFGSNGQIVIDLVPDLELIIGPQPDPPDLPPDLARNRFQHLFQSFISVLTSDRLPLVVFLDDLQWADSSSLDLVRSLLIEGDPSHLLIIGAYRDNEVSEDHPVTTTIAAIEAADAELNRIQLEPLDIGHVSSLIADTLQSEASRVHRVANLIYETSGGNPFHARALLRSLHEDHNLVFDQEEDQWRCDLDSMSQAEVSDNVAEFLAQYIEKLNVQALRSLEIACCVGGRFDLQTVAAVQNKTEQQVEQELEEPTLRGLIVHSRPDETESISTYRFVHDRVQEAVEDRLSDNERASTRLRLGRLMLTEAEERDEVDERVPEFIHHLNYGCGLVDSESDRLRFSELNLAAGRRAMGSVAFGQAQSHFRAGLRFLPADGWKSAYTLTLALHQGAAEAAFADNDYDAVEPLVCAILGNAHADLDRARALELRVMVSIVRYEHDEAVKTGLEAGKLLGLVLPLQPDEREIEAEFDAVVALLEQMSNEEILGAPETTDPEKVAVHRLITNLAGASYQRHVGLFRLMNARLVRNSIEEGHSAYSAIAFSQIGMSTAGHQDIRLANIANRMGLLASTLARQLGASEAQPRIDFPVYAFIAPWNEPWSDSIKHIRGGIAACTEVGDIELATRLMCFYSTYSALIGRELRDLNREVSADISFMYRHNQVMAPLLNNFCRQFILNLLGKSESPHIMIGEAYDESRSFKEHLSSGDSNFIFLLHFYKLILCHLFGQQREALYHAKHAREHAHGVQGMIFLSVFPFYESLILLCDYAEQSTKEQTRRRRRIAANQRSIQNWATNAPTNLRHKHLLVEAERARVRGHIRKATELYDRAIKLANDHGFINDAALANELASKFYEALDKPRLAEVYLREAYRLYDAWGAGAKTADLRKRRPEWIGDLALTTQASVDRHEDVDLDSILKASETFKDSEIAAEMLQRTMSIIIENAGAESGVLLLKEHGAWQPVAEKAVETDTGKQERTGIFWPDSVVGYVSRTKEPVILEQASSSELFSADPYFRTAEPQSVLCLPIVHMGEVLAVLYLENNQMKGVFTEQRLHTLNVICSQMALSLSNALRYDAQLRQFRYLYELRGALGNARSTEEAVMGAAEVIANALSAWPNTGVRIDYAGESVERGTLGRHGQAQYTRPIAYGGRTRGTIEVFSQSGLDESQERALLDETTGQLAHTLEALELEMQLLQSARLVSLGQMSAGVAHELNQPLSAISMTAGDIASRLSEGIELREEELKQMMQDVRRLVDHMAGTVDHLRVFSRDTSDEPARTFCLNGVVQDSLKLIAAQLREHDVETEIGLSDDLPPVVGIPNQVEQVVLNLLRNARDAVDEQEDGADKCLSVKTASDDGRVTLEVADTGIGMSEEDRRRVFEPFFTTKSADKGTGLGLSISYAIVKNHGGEIECASVAGEGTTFKVSLPLSDA